MKLECTRISSSIRNVGSVAEQLSDGIGDNGDDVCKSYRDFHKDVNHGTESLIGAVKLIEDCCNDLKVVEPEKLKSQGLELIRKVSNFPSNFS